MSGIPACSLSSAAATGRNAISRSGTVIERNCSSSEDPGTYAITTYRNCRGSGGARWLTGAPGGGSVVDPGGRTGAGPTKISRTPTRPGIAGRLRSSVEWRSSETGSGSGWILMATRTQPRSETCSSASHTSPSPPAPSRSVSR